MLHGVLSNIDDEHIDIGSYERGKKAAERAMTDFINSIKIKMGTKLTQDDIYKIMASHGDCGDGLSYIVGFLDQISEFQELITNLNNK